MIKSFASDETFKRIENLPEQQIADADAEAISKLYSDHPWLRGLVACVPYIGGPVDVLLTARAQKAFEGHIRDELEILRNALLVIDFSHMEGIETRLAEIEKRFNSLNIADKTDWVDESVDFQKLSEVYVAPAQYSSALSVLQTQRRLIITGPPHIGKSTTALQLAKDVKLNMKLQAIVRLQPGDNWHQWEKISNLAIILDDSFGASQFENALWANQWSEIISGLSKNNFVIATTRNEVLEQANTQSKLGEDIDLKTYLIELEQECSYDDSKLYTILEKHLQYASTRGVPQLGDEQRTWAKDRQQRIIQKLRFPHNIERFCSVHLPKATQYSDLDSAIEDARQIEKAVQKWVENLPPADRWFVFVVALFPRVPAKCTEEIYRFTANKFGFTPDAIGHLISRTRSYLVDATHPGLRHATYEEAVIKVLREQYELEVGRVVDHGLKVVLEADALSFARCLQADYGWPRYDEATLKNGFPLDPYLEQFASSYALLRDTVFPGLKPILQPCHCPYAGIVTAITLKNGGYFSLALVPGGFDSPRYQIYGAKDVRQATKELMDQAEKAYQILHVEHLTAYDLQRRSPQMHALEHIKNQIDHIFDRQRLPESHEMRMLRWEKILANFGRPDISGTKHLIVDPQAPFGETEYNSFCVQLGTLLSGTVPKYWPAEAWEQQKYRYAQNFHRLQRLMKMATKDGNFYTGSIIPSMDRHEGEYYTGIPRMSYSPEKFREVIHFGIKTIIQSYQWMVEFCFKPLRDNFFHYQRMPLKIVCAASYDAHMSWGTSHCHMYLLPDDFPTVNNEQIEILVEEITNSDTSLDPTKSPFSDSIRRRLEVADKNYIYLQQFNPYEFTSESWIIETVYKWLRNDLNQAMNWQDIGEMRSNQQLREIATRVTEDNRITGQNTLPAHIKFTLVDPWQIEDWER